MVSPILSDALMIQPLVLSIGMIPLTAGFIRHLNSRIIPKFIYTVMLLYALQMTLTQNVIEAALKQQQPPQPRRLQLLPREQEEQPRRDLAVVGGRGVLPFKGFI